MFTETYFAIKFFMKKYWILFQYLVTTWNYFSIYLRKTRQEVVQLRSIFVYKPMFWKVGVGVSNVS